MCLHPCRVVDYHLLACRAECITGVSWGHHIGAICRAGVGNSSVTIEQTHSVVLSTVVGYNVYRSTVSGSGFTKLNSSLVTTLTLHGHDRTECNDLFLCSQGGELQGQ